MPVAGSEVTPGQGDNRWPAPDAQPPVAVAVEGQVEDRVVEGFLWRSVEQVVGADGVLEALEREVEPAGLSTEVVHGHDGGRAPVAAVRKHRRFLVGDDGPRAQPELGRPAAGG